MNGLDVVDLLHFFEREAGLIRVDCLHPVGWYFPTGFDTAVFSSLPSVPSIFWQPRPACCRWLSCC